jgi:hypothetical protein
MKTNPMENKNWPDKVRLDMIEKSSFYGDGDDKIYQYGFYDGYQYAIGQKKLDVPSDEEIDEYVEKYLISEKLFLHPILNNQAAKSYNKGARSMRSDIIKRNGG